MAEQDHRRGSDTWLVLGTSSLAASLSVLGVWGARELWWPTMPTPIMACAVVVGWAFVILIAVIGYMAFRRKL